MNKGAPESVWDITALSVGSALLGRGRDKGIFTGFYFTNLHDWLFAGNIATIRY